MTVWPIVWFTVTVVHKRTVMDSSDWCFDNLSESHHQNQVGVIFPSKSGFFELIGQFLRDFTTHIDCKSKEA